MKRRSFVAIALASAIPVSKSVQANQVSPIAIDQLPPAASEFGKGWKRFSLEIPEEVDGATFIEGALTAYGGPHGQRVRIVALRHPDDRASVNAAWETATYSLSYSLYQPGYDIPYFDDVLDAAPLPEGVADAERHRGTIHPYGFEITAGVYAIEPNVVLLITAEGDEVFFEGAEITAADNVAASIAKKVAGSPAV